MEQLYEDFEKTTGSKNVENIVQNEENERESKYNRDC